MNLELQQNISIWRAKAAAGELELADMIKAVEALRQGRIAAQTAARSSASTSRKKPAAGPVLDGDDLLADLVGGISE